MIINKIQNEDELYGRKIKQKKKNDENGKRYESDVHKASH